MSEAKVTVASLSKVVEELRQQVLSLTIEVDNLKARSTAKRDYTPKLPVRQKPDYELAYESYRNAQKSKAIAEKTSVTILSMSAWLAQQEGATA